MLNNNRLLAQEFYQEKAKVAKACPIILSNYFSSYKAVHHFMLKQDFCRKNLKLAAVYKHSSGLSILRS